MSSVTLVDRDHICWNYSKIISRLVSVGPSFSADPNIMYLLQGEQPEIWAESDPPPVDLSVGDIRSHLTQIAAEWLQIAQRSQWRAYRKPSLFPMVPSLTTTSPSLQNGVPSAPKIRKWPYLRNGWPNRTYTSCLVLPTVGFSGSADRMALFPVTSNPSWRQAAILDNFEWPYLRNESFDPLI